MDIYCIISGQAIPVISFSMSVPQEEIPSFDIKVPTKYLFGITPYLLPVSVYRNGVLLIDGIVKTIRPYPEIPDDVAAPLQTTLRCDNNLGRLLIEAGANVHFQDTLVSTALATLLATTVQSPWALGDTATLQDVQITIDARDSESLWTQISSVTGESEFDTWVRYGGFSGGFHRLDVGTFGYRNPLLRCVMGDNLISAPRFQEPPNEPILIIYPVSGESSDYPVNLDDALNIDPTLSLPAQDYQILAGTGSIINNTISAGAIKRMNFDIHKTENDDPPTQAELDEAAISLYRRAKFELQSTEPHTSMTIRFASDVAPEIHDEIYFNGPVFEADYDFVSESTTLVPSMNVDGWYKIVNISADFRERQVMYDPILEEQIPNEVWELEVTDGIVRHEYNSSVIVYKKLKRWNKYDRTGSAIGVTGTRQVTINQNGVAADCAYGGVPATGKVFTFPVPAAPPSSTGVIAQVGPITPPNHAYDTTTYATIGGNHILCVQGAGGVAWGVGDNCTITVTFTYIS